MIKKIIAENGFAKNADIFGTIAYIHLCTSEQMNKDQSWH